MPATAGRLADHDLGHAAVPRHTDNFLHDIAALHLNDFRAEILCENYELLERRLFARAITPVGVRTPRADDDYGK
jgi:hypothetical protein